MPKNRSQLEAVAERYYDLQDEIGGLRRMAGDMLVACFKKMTAAEKRAYDRAIGDYAGGPQVPAHHPANVRCIKRLSKEHEETYRSIMRHLMQREREASGLLSELTEGVKRLGMVGGKRRKTRSKRGRKGKRVSTRRRRC